jgi:hypothetical protein
MLQPSADQPPIPAKIPLLSPAIPLQGAKNSAVIGLAEIAFKPLIHHKYLRSKSAFQWL